MNISHLNISSHIVVCRNLIAEIVCLFFVTQFSTARGL